jgi:hypothetical protein
MFGRSRRLIKVSSSLMENIIFKTEKLKNSYINGFFVVVLV